MEGFWFPAHWAHFAVNSLSPNASITSCSHCIRGVLVRRLGGLPNMPFGVCFYLLLLLTSQRDKNRVRKVKSEGAIKGMDTTIWIILLSPLPHISLAIPRTILLRSLFKH